MAGERNAGPCPNPQCGSTKDVRRAMDDETSGVAMGATWPMAEYVAVCALDLVLMAAWWVIGGWWIVVMGREAESSVRLVLVGIIVVAVGIATAYRFIDWVRSKARRRNREGELWGLLQKCGACGCVFFGEGTAASGAGYCVPKDASDVERYVEAAAGK